MCPGRTFPSAWHSQIKYLTWCIYLFFSFKCDCRLKYVHVGLLELLLFGWVDWFFFQDHTVLSLLLLFPEQVQDSSEVEWKKKVAGAQIALFFLLFMGIGGCVHWEKWGEKESERNKNNMPVCVWGGGFFSIINQEKGITLVNPCHFLLKTFHHETQNPKHTDNKYPFTKQAWICHSSNSFNGRLLQIRTEPVSRFPRANLSHQGRENRWMNWKSDSLDAQRNAKQKKRLMRPNTGCWGSA